MQPNAQTDTAARPLSKSALLAADAARLGVHRITLWRVIEGRTHNPELISKYQQIVQLRSKTHRTP